MFRRLLPLVLICIVAFSSVQMAVARGQAAPVDSIVICTGHGLVTILVDENGEPTGAVHLCPDCAMHLFSATADVAGTEALSLGWHAVVWEAHTTSAAHRSAPRPAARGPPALV